MEHPAAMKPALSTVAFPEHTLDNVVRQAGELGFQGLALRSLGHASTEIACDPCHVGAAKARDLFEDAGVMPAMVVSSIRYDAPVWPPVLGRLIGDFERPVRQTKQLVRVAAAIECPFVRVYGFEMQPGERRAAGFRRIVERLTLALTTVRHTGVRLLLENGGSFPRGQDVADLIAAVGSPLLFASYSPAAAVVAGVTAPAADAAVLGNLLQAVTLRDCRLGGADAGRPTRLGEGDVGVERFTRATAERGFAGWAVVEWDRLWARNSGDSLAAADALRHAAAAVYRWSGRPMSELERRKFAGRPVGSAA